MKRIVILNTGGTFSSRETAQGLAPQITGEEIRQLLELEETETELVLEDYCSLDSANITPSDWQGLARRVGQLSDQCHGIVIIHGTDTMAYTASMLSFMLQGVPIPVVLTGSQLPIGVPMSDAKNNLYCAVQMASQEYGGVFIAFGEKIILGCRASKVRTKSFQAFESINYPYIGKYNALGLTLDENVILKPQKEFQIHTQYSDRVAVLKLFPGMRTELFEFLREQSYEGIYLEAFGLGGIPFLGTSLSDEIQKTIQSGIPVLVGTQCRSDGCDLNIYETGRNALNWGAIPTADMTAEAAITKLMWCLGQTKDTETIRSLFRQNMVGEISLSSVFENVPK